MPTRGFFGRRPKLDEAKRLPPGQYKTDDSPVLSLGPTPRVELATWTFTLRHAAKPIKSWSWSEFEALPHQPWKGDIHCVTKWSKFDTTWCLILYSAQTWADLAYRDELLASNAVVRLITTRGPKQRDSDYERRLDRGLLAEVLGSWQQTPASSYVCGSTPFVETVTRALVELGLPPGSVRAERYGGVLPS